MMTPRKTRDIPHLFSTQISARTLFAKLILLSFITVTALFSFSKTEAHARANPKYASIVMDADTGMILYQRYANKQLHPASLTKVMTLMMLFDALEEDRISLRQRIRVSQRASNVVPSKLDLEPGSTIRVRDAIAALTTKSANDVAVAVAEHLGGTEANFAKMMTNKAHSLGMTRTRFRNASGLHDRKQVSTARDMAKMARTVISDYSKYYPYFARKTFTYKGKTYRNHNRLMKTYQGMDGMKTGYVQASGFNLISSAVRNNRRIIGVVFGGRTGKSRNRHMSLLLDRGFAKLNELRVASAKVPLPGRKPGVLLALAQLNNIAPAAGSSHASDPSWAFFSTAMKNNMFRRMIGEGDYDPAVSRRIETGLLAIAAHKGEPVAVAPRQARKAVQTASKNRRSRTRTTLASFERGTKSNWAIQVGAFASRAKTDQVIKKSFGMLPAALADASPIIVPLRTQSGWLFRGRISGYSRTEALRACSFIRECIPVAPQNHAG